LFNLFCATDFSEALTKIDLMAQGLEEVRSEIATLAVEHNLSNHDIWTETGRSEAEQTEFKDRLIRYYNRRGWWPGLRGELRCMVTNQWHQKNEVAAAHIWAHRTQGEGLGKFHLGRNDVSCKRNGFLVLKDIEKQFDKKYLCFVYNAIAQTLVVKVLNPALLGRNIEFSNPPITFAGIDGKQLLHPNGKYPFRRLLSFHARCSYKFAKEKGWITAEIEALFEPYHDLSDTASVPDIE
jgi:hypothetical protein